MAAIYLARAVPASAWTRPAVDAMTAEQEFDDFFLAHFDDLVRSLTAITGDSERARDCVQEAFIRAYARWTRIRRYHRPVIWVRRVAINVGHDMHRADTRRRRREDTVAPVSTDHRPIEQATSDLRLQALLEQLSPRQRTIAALFYVEDLSVGEIAASMSLSEGAVKFHLNRARAALHSLLDREEVSHG
ncbi:MAG: sigma-70 family RNA polymerase sigma factor [Acidimicrobiia bacterium]|nr:sigma-70 family RNA polymerase sigma factor [Acidimicrobiia bacterium]